MSEPMRRSREPSIPAVAGPSTADDATAGGGRRRHPLRGGLAAAALAAAAGVGLGGLVNLVHAVSLPAAQRADADR